MGSGGKRVTTRPSHLRVLVSSVTIARTKSVGVGVGFGVFFAALAFLGAAFAGAAAAGAAGCGSAATATP